MPAGIWAWDANGNPLIDTSTATVIQIGYTSGQTSAFSVTNDLFTKGIPWWFYIPRAVYNINLPTAGRPIVTFSGNTMNVAVDGSSAFDGTFIYGIRG